MNQGQGSTIFDKNGVRGVIENQAAPPPGATSECWCVRLENGQRVIVPAEALEARAEGGYFYLPVSLASFAASSAVEAERPQGGEPRQSAATAASFAAPAATDAVTIPVIAEEAFVNKREIEAGGVRLHKSVHERVATVDEPLAREEVNVERVTVNRLVDEPVAVRQEGDTLIVPVLEEVLVVVKRLMLREELHVTRRRLVTHDPQQVTLRREEVTVERFTSSAEGEGGRPVSERQPASGTAA